MNVESIIKSNAQKHKQINQPYNQFNGEGCCGERVCLKIKDAPLSVMYLPKPMMETKVCKLLTKHKSIEKIFEVEKEELTSEAYTEFWINFCELRLKYDFEFFAYIYLTIQDKITAADIPFTLNRGQRKLLKRLEAMRLSGLPIRIILLKARQWGGSTLVQLYMLWIQLIHKKNWNSVICAHLKDAAITIRAMFEKSIKNMPRISGTKHQIKPYQGTQNIKEVPERGCRITVGTAEEPESVRSQDAKLAHFSELGLYPDTDKKKTADLIASIIGSIPREPYTLIAYESTAKGVGNFFHTEWEKAKTGETVFEPVFVEWFLIDIYSEPITANFNNHSGKKEKGTIEDFVRTMTEYELNLFNNNPECTLENLNWYRGKLSEMTGVAIMRQEFPSDDIEAFQDSGMPAFRAEDVEALRKDCKPPTAIGDLVADCLPNVAKSDTSKRKEILQNIRFSEDKEALQDILSSDPKRKALKERNRLRIWEFPDIELKVSDRYVIVFDPQKGISEKADWGVITVFDRYWMQFGGKPEIVAEWRGKIDKDISIWIAAQIAKYYNNALLVIESNTYDSDTKEDDAEFIFDTIADYYSNLYSRTPADKIIEGAPVKYGFNTNRSTKPMIIANYVAMLRERGYIERNTEALNEARTYEQKKNGSFGAKAGRHDDTLMTRMIGCHICYELPLPKLIETTKKSYSRKPVSEASI